MLTAPIGVDYIPINADFIYAVRRGLFEGYSIMQKFGHADVGTAIMPITESLNYETPTTAKSLEIVSTDSNDSASGTGARKVKVVGLAGNWQEITQTVSTHAVNGTIAVAIPIPMIRLYRWFVFDSGTYATDTAGSHAGDLTIRETGGGTLWSQIDVTPFPTGQSGIGLYTIPTGFTGYLYSASISVDTKKDAALYFFKRENADTVTAPFEPKTIVSRFVGISGDHHGDYSFPRGPFVGPCDIGFIGNVDTGTGSVSVEFELLLIQDGF